MDAKIHFLEDAPLMFGYIPSGRPNHIIIVMEEATEGAYDLKAVYATCGCDSLEPVHLENSKKVFCNNCKYDIKPVRNVKKQNHSSNRW